MCRARVVTLAAATEEAPLKQAPSLESIPQETPYSPENSTSDSELHVHQPYSPSPSSVIEEKARRRPIKPWAVIPTDSLPHCHSLPSFPAGWKFNVYDGRLTHYFEIPSHMVAPTHGAIRYIEHYNETGPYSRFRFQVCHNHASGKCSKGFNCTYIHALQLPQSSLIHVNGVSGYPTLPAGVSLFVHTPGAHAAPQLIPSEYILRTAGSDRLFEDVLNGHGSVIHRPQHCAHFQFKKVCNRGTSCSFVHSLVPPDQ